MKYSQIILLSVTCLECNQVSTTFQHFQDLILDIRQASTTNVYDALENYFGKERLDGDESYHCEHCKKKVSAYKKFSIEKAPNALCIQLKRYTVYTVITSNANCQVVYRLSCLIYTVCVSTIVNLRKSRLRTLTRPSS